MRFSIFLLLSITFLLQAQDATNSPSKFDWSKLNSKQQLQALTFTTPAYRKVALRLVIEEANQVAQELNLPEQLPITETNLIEAHIAPPRMAKIGIGNITTSNYVYYVSVGNKFSFLVRTHLQGEYNQLQKQYLWPMGRMDTNAAYQLRHPISCRGFNGCQSIESGLQANHQGLYARRRARFAFCASVLGLLGKRW
jgi:hypothetical protein